jgi:hypothetical protein
VAGKNHWAWTFQNERFTYTAVDASRGKKAIDRMFKNGFPRAALVHDCRKPYFKTAARAHRICTAHLLRELKYLKKLYPEDRRASDFNHLLKDAPELKRELLPEDYLRPMEKRNLPEERLEELLNRDMDTGHTNLIAFRNRMTRYRQHLFLFLHRWDVPPDNNGSERAVRTFKVKQKVSELFRSLDGTQTIAVIRPVIDTAIKNGQNIFQALTCIARG